MKSQHSFFSGQMWPMVAALSLLVMLPAIIWSADVIVTPTPCTKAFKNPLKGFLGGTEYAFARPQYIPWNALERTATDGVERIKKWSDSAWAGLPSQNMKIIPQIWGEYPGRPASWPSDLSPGDYTSTTFINRMKSFIAKLGQAWNNDPRVAWMYTGLIGPWGEQGGTDPGNYLDGSPTMQAMCQSYADAFPNKLITYRHEPCNYKYGVNNMSWGCTWQASWYVGHWDQGQWKTNVWEGEISYDYCPPVHASGTEDCSDTVGMQKLCEIARYWHSTGCGWISNYTVGAATARGAEMFQMTNGYRLVIDTVRYTGQVQPGQALSVSFGVTNIGAAQFLYPWPVEVSLCDPSTKQPAWTDTFANLDIRKWLPGDKWDFDPLTNSYKTHKYLVPPIKYYATGVFTIPSNLAAREYVLALAILDPAGRLSSARFAIVNYWNGGRHPIGKVGVGVAVANPQLDPGAFNDLKADATLHYVYNPNATIAGNAASAALPAGAFVVAHRNGARTLSITLQRAGQYEARIAGLNGAIVAKAGGIAVSEGQTVIMNAPSPGMYVLHVKTLSGMEARRIEMVR